MKKDVVVKLTDALESAGFELVAVREETYGQQKQRYGTGEAFHSGEDYKDGIKLRDSDPTGTVLIEVRAK